ncbi:hypothetical protein R1flu_028645 [Riccia fluitans]|uniref:Uncharacterized protein n=1 Tax=Riccia fluitans TaxID=41844 RepID=A0ABD1XM97_9MARC
MALVLFDLLTCWSRAVWYKEEDFFVVLKYCFAFGVFISKVGNSVLKQQQLDGVTESAKIWAEAPESAWVRFTGSWDRNVLNVDGKISKCCLEGQTGGSKFWLFSRRIAFLRHDLVISQASSRLGQMPYWLP